MNLTTGRLFCDTLCKPPSEDTSGWSIIAINDGQLDHAFLCCFFINFPFYSSCPKFLTPVIELPASSFSDSSFGETPGKRMGIWIGLENKNLGVILELSDSPVRCEYQMCAGNSWNISQSDINIYIYTLGWGTGKKWNIGLWSSCIIWNILGQL